MLNLWVTIIDTGAPACKGIYDPKKEEEIPSLFLKKKKEIFWVGILYEGSQMPRLLIKDAHEWINEILTVPIYYLAKPQLRERA